MGCRIRDWTTERRLHCLDRGFLTISEDDIPNVRVLMTTVGGKVIHLMPELASQIGMDPADPVTGATNLFEGYYRSEWN